MKPFEEYLRQETWKACLRDQQWRLERDARRTREERKMRRYTIFCLSLCLLLLPFLLALMLPVAGAAEEPTEEYELVVCDLPPVPEEVWEDYENRKIEEALLTRATKLDNVVVTHYCTELRKHICGTGTGITASGRTVTPYVSVAVDPEIIPLGSDVLVDYGDGEIHYYRADDTGAWVNGNHIDVAVTTHDEALHLGVKTATVYWVAQEVE